MPLAVIRRLTVSDPVHFSSVKHGCHRALPDGCSSIVADADVHYVHPKLGVVPCRPQPSALCFPSWVVWDRRLTQWRNWPTMQFITATDSLWTNKQPSRSPDPLPEAQFFIDGSPESYRRGWLLLLLQQQRRCCDLKLVGDPFFSVFGFLFAFKISEGPTWAEFEAMEKFEGPT